MNVNENPGSARAARFETVRDDDRAMERIFELFIGNFYRFEMPAFEAESW